MPADVELARRPDVELVRTGRFQTLTGSWNPTPADIRAAVEAMDCPAIRKPVIRIGHTDRRFVGDGEPALGWFENLRAADGGHTLIADQVTLPWLHSVQAAAYPSRSIEGNYNHRCSEGHTHPFVIHTVALLGVTPPGVQTLRSLNDLPGMLGVAASGEVPDGAEHVQVTVLAGRHSFDEHAHPRDGIGKFAHAASNNRPSLPEANNAGLKRNDRVARRIPLGEHETYTGSGTVTGSSGAGVAVASVDGPDGPTLRVGVGIDNNDLAAWSGANKGATTVLDRDGMDQLATAIPQLLDAGKEGKATLKEFEKRDAALQKQERDLVNRQYPELTAAGKKELATIDGRSAEVSNELTHMTGKQQGRAELMPDAADQKQFLELEAAAAKASAAGGTEKLAEIRSEQRAALDKGLAGTDYEKIAPTLFNRDAARTDHLRAEAETLSTRRAELTAVEKPLSDADQADLDKVRADIVRNDALWGDFNDGSVLTEGSIHGEWGSLKVQVTMSSDEPQYSMQVVPADGSEPVEAASFEPSDLRKLASLLGKAGAGAAVKAAAGDPVHTGAMVALIPTVEDAARLAVDGGEPADELHVTLAYLGEAADLGAQGQQDVIDAVSAAANGLPKITADAFSVNIFNPPGMTSDDARQRDTCITLGMSGDLLDAVHTLISEALLGIPMPDQHAPWCAHVTLAYTDDLTQALAWTDRVGPITFDRLRLAFGGERVDIPLIEPVEDDAVPDEVYAAGGNADELKKYWLAGPGLAKWADKPHPWTALYKQLRKYIKNLDEAKRTASQWYREHFGHMPNQKGVKAAEAPPTPDLPAAEPEPHETPTEEDPVSLSDDMRSRLGLADDADEAAALAAIDELKAKADTPAEPTAEMVAASAAATQKAEEAEAEKDELRKEVQILASQMQSVSDELAATKAEKAATVKASVFSAAIKDGKIKPSEREQWERDYDEAPGAVTRVLASLAVGTAVPVMASGVAGSPEPDNVDDEYEALVAALDGPKAV